MPVPLAFNVNFKLPARLGVPANFNKLKFPQALAPTVPVTGKLEGALAARPGRA